VFHVAEEIAAPEYLGYHLLRDVQVVDQAGQSFVHTFRRYDCSDRGIRPYLRKMGRVFEEQGLLRHALIGSCRATLLYARDNVTASVALLHRDPSYMLTP
jgi:hypothetical protein